MKFDTSELSGNWLDRAVAYCDGIRLTAQGYIEYVVDHLHSEYTDYAPSTDWAQGGPIIAREGIQTVLQDEEADIWWANGGRCMQTEQYQQAGEYGPTILIAAMRCFVSMRLGETVEFNSFGEVV